MNCDIQLDAHWHWAGIGPSATKWFVKDNLRLQQAVW